MTLTAGARLGSYEILSPLGAGGMGEVYRARDAKLGREVAIKVLPVTTASDPDRRARFEQEARSASGLNHPNILTIYDIGEADGTIYIAMELVEGKTLRELIVAEALPTRKLLDLAVQTADGLAKAHAAGIVHRDLKPENLMVSRDGFVKILDFGLAKLTEPSGKEMQSAMPTAVAAPTQPGTVMGTAGYMSPEQASGKQVDFRSDQFSLGSILYEMATGQRAFQRNTGAETLVAIIREEPQPIAQLAPRAPAPVRWIVERCLAKDPEERYASTKDLARDLKSLRDHLTETSVSGALEAAEPTKARRRGWVVPALLALLLGAAGSWILQRSGARRPDSPLRFQKLTFQRGSIGTARFAPDGQSIVYGAAWDGRPLELFSMRADSTESRSLGLPGADVLSISATGELAISLGRHYTSGFETSGTLARVPLSGGAPREILENVQDADWSPDGKTLAISRTVEGRCRLEYPIGKVLYETAGWIDHVRVSPDGRLVAFADHPIPGDTIGGLKIVDAEGKVLVSAPMDFVLIGLAWSPDGREVLSTDAMVYATSLSGKRRVVFSSPSRPSIQDIARDGRALVSVSSFRREIVGASTRDWSERNLTWLDWSYPADLSRNGILLFNEQAVRPTGIYLRNIDGSPAVRLADGNAFGLSPDGRWALAKNHPSAKQLTVLPTGAGQPRLLPEGNLELRGAVFFPDGRRILIQGNEPGKGSRLWVQDISGGAAKPISPEGVTTVMYGQGVSPDGESVAAIGPDRRIAICSTRGGEPRPVPGVEPDEVFVRWTPDGRSLYVFRSSLPPGQVDVVDVQTGRRTRWKEFRPPDPGGVQQVGPVVIAPDESSYVYSYRRMLGDLYLVTGAK